MPLDPEDFKTLNPETEGQKSKQTLLTEQSLKSIKPTIQGDVVLEQESEKEKDSLFESIEGKEPETQIQIERKESEQLNSIEGQEPDELEDDPKPIQEVPGQEPKKKILEIPSNNDFNRLTEEER